MRMLDSSHVTHSQKVMRCTWACHENSEDVGNMYCSIESDEQTSQNQRFSPYFFDEYFLLNFRGIDQAGQEIPNG